MTSVLFGRKYRLTVAPRGSTTGLDVSELAFAFVVKKNLKPEPNTCTVRITNLSRDHRRYLSQTSACLVSLEAGYTSGTSLLYRGEARSALSEVLDGDVITTLTSGDSVEEMQKSRINMSISAKSAVSDVIAKIVKVLGVGVGNTAGIAAKLRGMGIVSIHPRRTVITGNAARVLTGLCASVGLEWSVQDGAVQILERGRALPGTAVALSSSTGLVGSPTIDADHVVSATSLLIPEIRPGVLVSFSSLSVSGNYRVVECEYIGDTFGNDWYVKMQCKRVA